VSATNLRAVLCLAYIDETWTDTRPASLRRWMRDHERAGAD